ncbi:MAG: hypothetical protein C0597_07675, partial [Marinilabiliales bacterium]
MLVLLVFQNTQAFESNMQTQTIRGKVIDQDSKSPLIGANIIILNSDPIRGTSSDADGYFKIDQVHVGRVDLKI